jgi:NADH dehydrogenase
MGISLTGIFAIGVKHLINMVHLFGTAGVNQVWEYVKCEFLDVKNERSFVGGLVSYKVRGYWPLLLRLWLGFMWVVEATDKITQGWLDFSSGKSQTGWMFSKGVVQAGLKVADAATAATAVSAGTAAGAVASSVDVTSAASAAVSVVSAGAAVGPAVRGPWLDTTKNILDPASGLVTWFRRIFMDGIFAYLPYAWFQVLIIFTELLIGLALFGGLFTWWAAVVSIGLCLIFTLSGMFAWNQLWFVFAAILMMGGAGRAFGLDTWVVPFFKKWWNGTRLARKSRLYADEPTK